MPDSYRSQIAEASPRPQTTNAAAWREAPTWFVVATIYAGWGCLTWFYHDLPSWLVLPLGAWLVAWHNSFQHEAVHGHPTPHRWLNAALASPPLGLWMPYSLYRESHLAHHRSPALTDPVDDPESYYVTPVTWAKTGRLMRALLIANNTLAGRMTIGPLLVVGRFWIGEARRLVAGDHRNVPTWLFHLVLCGTLLVWVIVICRIPLQEHVLLFAWPGLSLTLLRSYAEHRPAPAQQERSAIVEAGPILRLLFLNNNLHALHHDRPGLPWYALPGVWRRDRAGILQRNGTYLFSGGYLEVARRFLLAPKDLPVHPD